MQHHSQVLRILAVLALVSHPKHSSAMFVVLIISAMLLKLASLSNWIGAYLESSTTILLIIGENGVLHYIHTNSNYV